MKKILILVVVPIFLFSQKYTVDNSTVTFFSSAPIEDIKAESSNLQGVVDFSSNEFFFRIPINSFIFPSSLMQQHFNESYLESHLYPLSIFKGTIDNQSNSSNKIQFISNEGVILIHGIEKNIIIETDLVLKNDEIVFSSQFLIRLKDFDIKVPKMFVDNIAEVIEVSVKGTLVPLD